VGAIVTGGTNVLYQSYSDYRLKENVADLTGALDKVNSLQPKTFNYINTPETTNEGFIAHELQEVVPQAVSGTKDGVDEDGNPKYQGVDNAHIVPLLVGAIKELKAEIETLKAQINN
ncbi:tail fiber domain-containing protein, partial [archaeon]|nr:tail fiber domain-containing protein [archaeon]